MNWKNSCITKRSRTRPERKKNRQLNSISIFLNEFFFLLLIWKIERNFSKKGFLFFFRRNRSRSSWRWWWRCPSDGRGERVAPTRARFALAWLCLACAVYNCSFSPDSTLQQRGKKNFPQFWTESAASAAGQAFKKDKSLSVMTWYFGWKNNCLAWSEG